MIFSVVITKAQVSQYDHSNLYGLKQGDTLSPLHFNFALEYANRRSVQVNWDGLKLNGTNQLLVYADDDDILRRSVHNMKKNAEAIVVARKDSGLAVDDDRTKYMGMS